MEKITKMFCGIKSIYSIVILVSFLLISFDGKAQTFKRIELEDLKPSDNKYTQDNAWKAEIINNVLHFSAIVGDVDCDENDDKIVSLSVSLNSVEIFHIIDGGGTLGKLVHSDDSCVNEDLMMWQFAKKISSDVTGTIRYENHNNAVVDVYYPLSKEFLASGTCNLTGSVVGDFNDTVQNFSPVVLRNNILPKLPFITAKEGCNSVIISWSNIDFSAFNANDFKYEVYNGSTFITSLDSDAKSVIINDVKGPITATIALKWKGETINEVSIDGSPSADLSVPVDLQASIIRCDGSVDLKWQWLQASPTNFVIYNSNNDSGPFVLVSEIAGSKRSFNVPGLERGKKYYFKIAAKGGKCPGEGPSSEDAVMGFSPSAPMQPLEPTMKFLNSGESGVLLSWNENQWSDSDFKEASTQKYIITRKDIKRGIETKIEIPIGDLYNDFVKDKVKGVKGFLLSYLDKEVNTCESYSYKISASNLCTTSAAIFFYDIDNITNDKISIAKIDLSRVFKGKNLEASKGYYGNLVQLSWSIDEYADFVGVYKVYRRILGSLSQPELLQTFDKSIHSCTDITSVANVLYEYYIVAEADCGLEKLISFPITNVIGKPISQLKNIPGLGSEIGFRLPTATITGNITYTGGIAVPNVKVVAERNTAANGKSLEFDGTNQYIKINPEAKLVVYNKTGLSTALWIKPQKITGTQMLASLQDGFELKLAGAKVKVSIGNNDLISKSDLDINSYTHLFATCSADSLSLYINGKKDVSIKRINMSPLIESSTEPIYLGDNKNQINYQGTIDEFRIYNVAVSAAVVQRDYNRLIASETPNLVGYWRFDEGVGPFVFDSSKDNGVFHKLDGEIIGAKWSNAVPSKEQLGFGGYTDKNGNYAIEGILYNGTGENFNVTPTMTLSGAVHGFAPVNRVLFLGEGRTSENQIDFIDQSSFEVTGSVRFNFDDKEGTSFKSSGSEGVGIWIDGTQQALKDGKPILTDNFGQFKIVVPIGKHYLEFRKEGHVFEESRFPSQLKGLFDFQDRLSGIEVLDNTKHKFVGCVVGGLIEGNKKLGFSAYKGKLKPTAQRVNNIGATYFILTSVDTKIKRKVTTDPETGEFEIQLPPMEYEFSDVKFVGKESNVDDDKVLFFKSDLQSIKLATEDAYKGIIVEDSVLVAGKYVLQKVNFNAEKRLIYRSRPEIVVLNNQGNNFLPNKPQLDTNGKIIADRGQVGEKTIKIADKSSGKDILISTQALTYPLFLQGNVYQQTIKGVEKYEYYGEKPIKNPSFDQVPVLDGEVTISNNFSAREDGGIVAGSPLPNGGWTDFTGTIHQMKLMSNGSVAYVFAGGDPDFIKKGDVNDTFTKAMAITLKTGSYTVYWPVATDPSAVYKGYILGAKKLPGTDFITEAPAAVESVLRMPPGTKSSLTIEKGTKMREETSVSTKNGGNWNYSTGPVLLKTERVPLIGTEVAGIDNEFMAGTYGSAFDGNTTTTTFSSSVNERITITNEGSPYNKGDFFISKSDNIEVGMAKAIQFVSATDCNECIGPKIMGNNGIEYKLDTAETFYQKPSGTTKSLYSENHIKTDIIPKLESMRNSLFVNQSNLYVSKVEATYPLYGTNNDDPRWDDDLLWDKQNKGKANGTDYTKTDEQDDDGSSYTFNRSSAPIVKGIKQDKVRWYNEQIRAWREILMDNETEKWGKINGPVADRKNISISSGATYNNVSVADTLKANISSTSWMAGVTASARTSYTAMGIGVKLVISGAGEFSSGNNVLRDTIKSVTTSYIIKDDDPYNVFNVNVFKGSGNDGPVFQIVAGQTSCPFEREKELDVTKKHLYYLKNFIKVLPSILENKREELFYKYVSPDHSIAFSEYNFKLYCDLANSFQSDDTRNYKKMKDQIDVITKKLEEKRDVFKQLIEAYNNNTKPLLGNRTVQIQKPGLLVNGGDRAIMRNVPSSKAATFDLDLRNETELKPTQGKDIVEYLFIVGKNSNPDGLTVLLNGQSLVQPVYFLLPFGQQMRQTLTVLRGPKKYDYKDLSIVMMSPCDTSIVKSVKIDINYIPVCAEAAVVSPGNKWTINYDSKNKLPVKINGYDVNYQGFKGIKIQYKKTNESDSDWKLLQTYYRDEDTRKRAIDELKEDNPNAPLLNANDFIYNWDVTKLPDDLYDLRIQSVCDGENEDVVFTSPVISGIIDRVNPSSFGAPQPSDGVLSAGDEIMLQFNEPINAGLLSPYNFDIRGVVQGGELRHPASLYFNGAKDYMEIPAGIQLNRRSFSVDFYAKRKRSGAEILLSQGSSSAQSFTVGFNSANQFEVSLAGVKISSSKAFAVDDSWIHLAYVYDATNQLAKVYINGKLDALKQNYLPNYEATGKIVVGKDLLNLNSGFQGNIHELRLWGKALTESQINTVATQRMKSNEPGLLGNWLMEEGEGKLAKDIIRERHAEIISATWQVALKGNALVTNSNTQPTISSPTYLDISNFSIEFWFKGDNTSNATLLSNGRGDIQDGNINGWSIRAGSAGLFEVWNNNRKFIASNTNYFDNQWHHFALVVNRQTNIVCFIDGNQQNTMESLSSGFSGFGGAALHLGAMGWMTNNGIARREQPFTGALDEIRIWQGARNASQIKRDMRYMLSGDEVGLDLYLPFDKYNTTMGIELLEPSAFSSASNLTAVKENGFPAAIKQQISYMQETPLVKLPRPVRKVNFSYTTNQDKIILTTEDPDSILENVSLDISASNVQDLNGNVMRAPVSWTAYVDRNQVNWIESDKHFQMESGKEFSFINSIKNGSGKVYNYSINNLPVWLKANPSSGVIAPLSSSQIVFTVDKDVNIGNYVQDIQLLTEFGFAEIMNLSLDVFKPLPTDWKVTPSNFQYSMNFVVQLSINGDISRDPNDQVAAFVGDECRGLAKLRYVPELDNYQAYISVYSNRTLSESVKFRIWNASDGQVHRDVTPIYNFESNGVKGSAIKPEILKAENVLEYTYDLAKGWTWISTHLDYNPTKTLKVNDLLSPLKLSTDGDLIRSIDAVDSYSKTDGWLGTLTGKGGVTSGRGYKIFLNNAEQLKYSGALLKGDQVKIDLVKGWNWIGYIGLKKMTINQALSGFTQVKDGDVIKSQFALAIYSVNTGWIGDLTYLSPGEGYMIKVGQDGGFNYPNLSYANSGKNLENNSDSKETRIDASYKYPNSMNAIVDVVGDDQSMANKLRAYAGKELRGEATPVYNPVTKKQTYFMTIYGAKMTENIRFEFLESNKDKIFTVNETYNFNADGILGSANKPELLTLKSKSQLDIPTDNNVMVHPNPFTNFINLKLEKGHAYRALILFDLQGRQIIKMKVLPEQDNLDLETGNLPAAVYLMGMYDDNGKLLKTQRLIKK